MSVPRPHTRTNLLVMTLLLLAALAPAAAPAASAAKLSTLDQGPSVSVTGLDWNPADLALDASFTLNRSAVVTGGSLTVSGASVSFGNATLSGGPSFGSAMAIGDITGNGQPELVVGEPDFQTNKGRTSIFSTDKMAISSAGHLAFTGDVGKYMGTSVLIADIASNSSSDLVFSGPGFFGAFPGMVVVCNGGTDALAETWSYTSSDNTELFGTSLASGDLNGDGFVNGADLGLLLLAWGPCPAPCPEDLNGDGAVDGADLGLLLLAWSS